MKKRYRSFPDARKFVQSLELKSGQEWREYTKSGNRPSDIPTTPARVYKNEWKGMGDWCGTGTVAPQLKEYWSFKKARNYVRKLGIKSSRDWRAYAKSGKLPKDIPSNPVEVYKSKGWIGSGDWLGTGTISNQLRAFWSFKKARNYVRKLGLNSKENWFAYAKSGKLPKEIPIDPSKSFKEKGWIGWGDWCGTGTVATFDIIWLPWKEAKPLYQKIAKENGITGTKQWVEYVKTHKLPKGLPPYPLDIYSKERIQKRLKND